MDILSSLLTQFQHQAEVFFTGNLCELSEFDEANANKGHLHILNSGQLHLIVDDEKQLMFNKPTLLFFPQGRFHQLLPDKELGADLVCASIDYHSQNKHPLMSTLPDFMHFDLSQSQNVKLLQTANWIFDEAFASNNGKSAMVNKLCDIFIIQILREIVEQKPMQQGLWAGLANEHIAKAILAMHENVSAPWRVESLAREALMSRSKFAMEFNKVVGKSPIEYLSDWRIYIAQGLLQQKLSVHSVANKVGYRNGSALTRVFKQRTGLSPREWLKQIN